MATIKTSSIQIQAIRLANREAREMAKSSTAAATPTEKHPHKIAQMIAAITDEVDANRIGAIEANQLIVEIRDALQLLEEKNEERAINAAKALLAGTGYVVAREAALEAAPARAVRAPKSNGAARPRGRAASGDVTARLEAIVSHVKKNKGATRSSIADALSLDAKAVGIDLVRLNKEGRIKKHGDKRATTWSA